MPLSSHSIPWLSLIHILPAIANYYYAVKEAGGDKVFIAFPDLILVNVLNSFFHAAAPFLDRAEEAGFTYGCRHCPLNKMRLTAYICLLYTSSPPQNSMAASSPAVSR